MNGIRNFLVRAVRVVLSVVIVMGSPIMSIAALCLIFSDPSPNLTETYFHDFTRHIEPWYLAVTLGAVLMGRPSRSGIEAAIGCAVIPVAITTFFARNHLIDYWLYPLALAICAATWIWAYFALPKEPATREQNGGASNDTNPEAHQFEAVRQTQGFSAVIGMADLKTRLREASNEILASMSKKELKARNGILLFGEPGNGKTLIAQALAGECKIPLLTVSIGNIASQWVGQGTERIMAAFAAARAQAPCVLFLDEIDSLIRDRAKSMAGGSAEEAKMTNALLTEMVNIRNANVILVAATNYIDQLDQAAIREGRFDFKIEITPPDYEARLGLIRNGMLAFKGIQITATAMQQAANRWDGFSVSRIRAIVEEAGRVAKQTNDREIDYKELSAAMRRIQGRSGDVIPAATPTLDKIIMSSDQLAKLRGIAHRMSNIEEIEKIGGSVPSGVLFFGPPGTGKTLTVRALAKTTGWPLKTVSGSDLMADAERLDQITAFARANRPCIIFLDEADDVLADRRNAFGQGAALTNKLLAAIDGAKGKTADVLWIAATNHPDSIDEAALRGGRFTEKIEFSPPDAHTAEKLVGEWLASTKAPLERTITAATVTEILDGHTPANIAAVLQQAVNQMIERRASLGIACNVTLNDIIEARRVVVGS